MLIIINACSGVSNSMYPPDYTLTTQSAAAKSGSLSVKIPAGWFAADDNENIVNDLWLIKNNYSASLNFVPVNVDTIINYANQTMQLESVMEMSVLFKKAKLGGMFKGIVNKELFSIGHNEFIAYEFVDETQRQIRVVLFKLGPRFYEVSAIPQKSSVDLGELYRVQNSVLNSIQ